MRLFRLYLVAAMSVLAAGSSWAADKAEVAHYRLDNGLEVILAPDHKVPKFGMSLVYRVGSSSEQPGRSGFAHLFEHLMFSGTKAYPRIDDTYSALGIANNAFTEMDRTRFVAEGLASALPVVLSVEADRMANLGANVDQSKLDIQRSVVKNEMRQNLLDSPGATGMQVLRTALFPTGHPYARPTIGSVADLDAASLEDVRAFFETHYGPNNAILSIAGDFDVAEVIEQIADTFGRVPRRADVAPPATTDERSEVVRFETSDRVPAPYVALGISGPPMTALEDRALDVAVDLLGNPGYGVLRRELVLTGVATSASANWESMRLAGRLVVVATAADGVSTQELEAALRQTLKRFAATEVRAEDLERTRRSILLDWRLFEEPVLGRARALSLRSDVFGELGDDELLLALTPQDVERVAREFMTPDAMSVMTIIPGAPGDLPPMVMASSGEAVPMAVSERPEVEIPQLTTTEPGHSVLPPSRTLTLGNGIQLIHYRMPDAATMHIAAMVTGGTGSDIPGKEGLTLLTSLMMSRGAGERDLEAFRKATSDAGAEIMGGSLMAQSAIILAVPPDTLTEGVALMVDALLSPRFDEREWAAVKAQARQSLIYSRMTGGGLGYYALRELLFPPIPGRAALEPTPESVDGLSLEDVRQTHRALFTPRTMTIYSVGPLSAEAVGGVLEPALGGWNSESGGLPALQHPSAAFGAGLKVQVVPTLGQETQATIYLARPAPGLQDPDFIEAVAVGRLLGGDFTSRLNQVLREAKGYSYGTSAAVAADMPTGGMLLVTTAVEFDKVGESLADMLAGFAGLATEPVTAAELNRTAMATATGTAGSVETSASLAGVILQATGLGMTPEELTATLDRIVALELPAVQAVATTLSSLDAAVVVIAGDPDVIVPQLEGIGIRGVEVLGD